MFSLTGRCDRFVSLNTFARLLNSVNESTTLQLGHTPVCPGFFSAERCNDSFVEFLDNIISWASIVLKCLLVKLLLKSILIEPVKTF